MTTNNNQYTQFQCIKFLADGKHIDAVEDCETAKEAIERAEKWRAVGHIAMACLTVVDTKAMEVYNYPLD